MLEIPEINYQFSLLVGLVKGYIDDIAGSDLGTAINLVGMVFDAMFAYILIVRLSAKSKNAPSVSVSLEGANMQDAQNYLHDRYNLRR
jgi:hypothetical protein